MSQKAPLSIKRSVRNSALILLPLFVLFGLLFQQQVSRQEQFSRQILLSKADSLLRTIHLRFEENLRGNLTDLIFLANAPAMRAFANGGTQPPNRPVTELLREFCGAKASYDQVRLIGLDGTELVRINNIGGVPAPVNVDRLQDKSDRDYFIGASSLPPDGVYISAIDLNVEFGAIERPYKPVLRMATPVHDNSGSRKCYLVLNILASRLLEAPTLRDSHTHIPYGVTIADADGFLLKGEFPGDEWGRQIPQRKNRTYDVLHPEAWAAMAQSSRGDASTPEGLFSFMQFSPGRRTAEETLVSFHGPGTTPLWLIAFIPQANLMKSSTELDNSTMLFMGIGLLVLTSLSFALGFDIERRKASALLLAESNNTLQQSVEELARETEARRNSEQEAQDLSARLQNVLDAASEVAIIATDPEGTITVFNEGAERMLGLSEEQALGKLTPLDFHDPDELAERLQAMEQHAPRAITPFEVLTLTPSRKGSETRSWTYLHSNGQRRVVSLSVTSMRNDANELNGFLFIAVDITERDAIHKRLEGVMAAAPDAIITLDDSGTIISANQMAGTLFKTEVHTLRGRHVGTLLPTPYNKILAPQLYDAGSDLPSGMSREFPGKRSDGALFPMEASTSVIHQGASTTHILVLRDISRRKQAEEALIKTKNLLERQQADLDGELRAAARVQKNLMPKGRPTFKGVSLAWRVEPSTLVGGDIFNIRQLAPGLLEAYMLDVVGHGMSSALVAATAAQALRLGAGVNSTREADGTLLPIPPGHALTLLNEEFPLERFDSYFSMILLRLHTESGELEYAGAGHPAPLILRNADRAVEEMDYAGPVVGAVTGHDYKQYQAKLNPGDTLILFTDGCIELKNLAGESFGAEGLSAALSKCVDHTAEDALESIWFDLKNHGGSIKPDDDLTLFVLRYDGIA